MALYWNGETFVTAAEHFGYKFEHSWENWMGDGDAVDEFLSEYEDIYDVDSILANHIELDYENGSYYLDPDLDPDDYSLDSDDTPMTVIDHLIDDGTTSDEVDEVLRQMRERFDEMMKGEDGYQLLFWSDRDRADFATLEHNYAALLNAWGDIVSGKAI